jgi:hypothetical protein
MQTKRKRKNIPVVKRFYLADGSVIHKIVDAGKKVTGGGVLQSVKLPDVNVELKPDTKKTLYGVVIVLGSMYVIGGLIRMNKIV